MDFVSCGPCLLAEDVEFQIEADWGSGTYKAVLDFPPYRYEVSSLDSTQIAEFTYWASLVRDLVRNRLHE